MSLNYLSSFLLQVQAYTEKIHDRFGKEYTIDELYIDTVSNETNLFTPRNTMLCSNTGYFRVFFENGSGFEGTSAIEIARRDVICQLFQDLSNFIVPANPNTPINIWFRNISVFVSNPATSGAVALASSFYVAPGNLTNGGGIVDGEVWKSINTGIDSYGALISPNTTYPLYTQNQITGTTFHGFVAFNFNNPAFSNLFSVDLNALPNPGEIDLYSIALHEMLHVLGIGSLVSFDGLSSFGIPSGLAQFYSRYDLFLKTTTGENLITNPGPCSLYDYEFNPNLNAINTLSPNPMTCGGTIPSIFPPSETFNCPTNIVFSGTVNQSVYTPDCFEMGSSLSHLEDQCHSPSSFPNNEYYVMSNNTITGIAKRFPKEEEKQILCDLGYHINNFYGNNLNPSNNTSYISGICNDVVAGSNDGISSGNNFTYTVNLNAPTPLTITDVLVNDFNANHYECLEVIYGNGTILNDNGISFDFENNQQSGISVLRYIPVSTSGSKGNITYVYIYVVPVSCQNSPCNLISNGDFEAGINCGQLYVDNPNPKIDCWESAGYTPDYLVRNCSSITAPNLSVPTTLTTPQSETWSTGINNNHAMIAMRGSEGIQNFLSNPILPNVTYQIGFFAKVTNGQPGFQNVPDLVSIYAGNSVIVPTGTGLPVDFVFLNSLTIPANSNNQWNYVTTQFTYSGPLPLSTFALIRDDVNNPNLTANQTIYTLFDEISIVPVSGLTSISFPTIGTICQNQLIPDLMPFVSPQGGTFSGPGISFNGSTFQFDPLAAGPGTHTIAYLYDNGSGCIQITPSTITVVGQNVPNIIFSPNTTQCTNSGILDLSNFVNITGGTFSGIGVSGNTFNPLVAGPGTHDITYLYTEPVSGCTVANIQSITVELCCPSSVGTISLIQPGTYPTLNLTNPVVTYYVQGNIVLTGNHSFNNANIVFNDNASITVANNATLSITGNSKLYSCNLMWDGIIVEPNAFLTILGSFGTRPVIEDAKIAVKSVNGANIRLQFCDLNRNHKGIYFTSFSGNHPAQIGPLVRIMTQNSLIPTNNIQTSSLDNSSLGNKTLYGIEIESGGTLTIGSNNPAQILWNQFNNCRYGIFGSNVNATIICNKFNDISGPVPPLCSTFPNCTPMVGTAIYLKTKENRSVSIGTSTATFNIFTNCKSAIDIFDYTNASVKFNNFNTTNPGGINTNGLRGVQIVNNSLSLAVNMDVEISNNNFSNTINPIRYYYTNMSFVSNSNLKISNNNINQNLNRLIKGITVEALQPLSNPNAIGTNSWLIQNNSISAVQDGIIISNIQIVNTTVSNNTITTTQGTTRTGIRVANSKVVTVKKNTITGTGNTAFQINHKGIWASLSPRCFFQCNTINNTGQSIVFEGPMLLLSDGFSGNTMNNAYRGFVLLNGGTVGQRGTTTQYSDNRWTGTFTNYKTYTENTTNANTASPLYTRTQTAFNPAVNFLENGSNILNAQYSQSLNGLIPYTGGQAYLCITIGTPWGSFPFGFLQEIARNTMSYGIMEANSAWLARRNLYKDIPLDPNLTADPVLDSFYIAEQSGTFSKLEQFSQWMADTNYIQAENVNNSIVAGSTAEDNYKLFQAIILKLAKGLTIDENDYLILEYIAQQCPVSGGEVVYQARSFLNLLNPIDLDFEDGCEAGSQKKAERFEEGTEPLFSIFPNPASENLSIKVQNIDKDKAYEIVISSVLGQEVARCFLNKDSEAKIQFTGNIPNGIYLILLYEDGSYISGKQFIISK